MTDREARIADLLTALNAQDFEAGIALLHPDVDWQDVMYGGRRRGRADVRAYWGKVYAQITSGSSIIDYRRMEDGRIAAHMLHSVRDKAGKLWSEEATTHVFTFKDDLIIRMDLDEGPMLPTGVVTRT